MTQTLAIRRVSEYLGCEGWSIIYQDFPGGRRSGVGRVARINSALERIYNKIPDILAVKDATLLLTEVDASFDEKCEEKFRVWEEKIGLLLEELTIIMQYPVRDFRFGFAYYGRKHSKHILPSDITTFRISPEGKVIPE